MSPTPIVTLQDFLVTGFNNPAGPLTFEVSGTEFVQDLTTVVLTINGAPVSVGSITVGPTQVVVSTTLSNGENIIVFSASGTGGETLHLITTVWAGTSTLTVQLVLPDGSDYLLPATVTAQLSDDADVTDTIATSTGTAVFFNLPPRTIVFDARGANNEVGAAGALGSAGSVTITLAGFNVPSSIDNNDFSQGPAGWETGTGPVTVVPHVENVGPGSRRLARQALVDNDLKLDTGGIQGENIVSRTFTTEKGIAGVNVRFRFVTSEVPGGYFGTQFNDYYRVSIRSERKGDLILESYTMNGLGLAAFDYASGSTGWRYVTLDLDCRGDTVQVDIAVANVADGLFDSQVYVDFVSEIPVDDLTDATQRRRCKACQIQQLDDDNSIHLLPSRVFPVEQDYANARDNIVDQCKGQLALLTPITDYTTKDRGVGQGCTTRTLNVNVAGVRISERVLDAIIAAANTTAQVQINAIAGGCHSSSSHHYRGNAVDFQHFNTAGTNTIVEACQQQGALADPAIETNSLGQITHSHCAYSPAVAGRRILL